MKTQYYLNHQESPKCPQIPTRYTNYLDKNNYLSEFITQIDKEIARQNLGIPELIQQLNSKIDAKVIDRGAIAWDLVPTEGESEKVLSSGALYNTFLRYALKTELDNNIQQVWADTVNKITETYNKIEDELNDLDSNLRQYTDDLRCEFDSFTTNLNQQFTEFTEHIVEEFNRLESETDTKIQNLENFVNDKTQNLEDFVNTKTQELQDFVNEAISQIRSEMTDLDNSINEEINQLNESVNQSLSQIRTEMNELSQNIETNVQNTLEDFQKSKYIPLEKRMDSLEVQVKSFLESAGGTALTDEFGSNDYLGVNQKTLTNAINKIWEVLENITGESLQGIDMTVTPSYFISESGCNVHINASTVTTNGIFEHIAFYVNGELIVEDENVDYLDFDTYIKETSVIKCVAKIMGIEYTRQEVVTHYNSFWLGAGTSYEDIMDVEHVIPITNGIRGSYDVNVEQGDHIIVIIGESLKEGFIRADINSVEIPFTESTVTVDGNNYKVFTSVNTYVEGTYNIDIEGKGYYIARKVDSKAASKDNIDNLFENEENG